MRDVPPPFYFIYGEQSRDIAPRFIHVEKVSDRGKFHDNHVAQHSHPHLHQLSFWPQADGHYTADNDVHPLKGPTLVWMPAGTVHGFEVSAESDSVVVSMSDDFLTDCMGAMPPDELLRIMRQPLVVPVGGDIAPRLHAIFREIEGEYAFPSWAQGETISALARLAFITIARLVQTREHASTHVNTSLYARFLALLDEHFREQRTVDDYVQMLATTAYLLNRATRQGAGMRASEVIRTRVIREAKRLLLFTMLDVASVGFTLGFDDAAHFGRLFRKSVGISPARWRTEQRIMLTGRNGGDQG